MCPVLDYCARMRQWGQRDIEAIFLYTMNALAPDHGGDNARVVIADGGRLCLGSSVVLRPLKLSPGEQR